MCSIIEQSVKFSLMGGEVEHNLCQLLAEQRCVDPAQFSKTCKYIEKRLVARSDLWAIEYFHRIKQRIEANPKGFHVAAQLTEEQSPGETVNAALMKEQSILT